MSYPGNPSLSPDIQERIRTTYEQTLELASKGSRQEASLGCDFILRLDADFEPARILLSRLESGEGPVEVDDLRPGAPGFVAAGDSSATSEGGTGQDGSLSDELRALFAERRYEELVERAAAESDAVTADPKLAEIAQNAQARLEAQPYVKNFLDSARQAYEAGESDKAAKLVEGARELDPEHPGVKELDRLLSGTAPDGGEEGETLDAEELGLGAFEAGEELGELELDDEPQPLEEEAAAESTELTFDEDGGEPGDTESEGRIRQLLDEGQASFEKGEYQEAIDAWSRIFLIDIDHEEAATRIEEARRLKAEQERKVEEVFHDAVEKMEAGEKQEAIGLLQRVLELQPGHLAAREHLEQLESGAARPAPTAEAPAEEVPPPPSGPADEELHEEIMVPPEPGAEEETEPAASHRAATTRRVAATAKSTGSLRTFLYVGGPVLVALLIAAWFLFQNQDRFFPNAATGEPAETGATMGPVERATKLHEAGGTEAAMAQLRRLPPSHPRYDEAQALITQWEAELAPPPAEAEPATPAPVPGARDEAALRRELISGARDALAIGDHLDARDQLQEAAAISELSEQEQLLLEEANAELEPLSRQIELVRGGDWEFALRELWRLHEAEPGNRNVTHLLVDAYYNLAVRDLQRGDAESAAVRFEEAVDLAPQDEELQRHLRFARSYRQGSKDLLYQIYVRYLPFR